MKLLIIAILMLGTAQGFAASCDLTTSRPVLPQYYQAYRYPYLVRHYLVGQFTPDQAGFVDCATVNSALILSKLAMRCGPTRHNGIGTGILTLRENGQVVKRYEFSYDCRFHGVQ